MGRTAVYIDNGGSTEYTSYLYDVQGSVIETLTAAGADSEADVELTTGGNIARPYRYTPYGGLITGEDGQSQSGLLYNGEFCDGVTGMIYLRARWYTPEEARFFQPDIVRGDVSDPQSLNRYAYVRNNPVRYADPSGELLIDKVDVGSGVGALITVRAAAAVNTGFSSQKRVQNSISGPQPPNWLPAITAVTAATAGRMVSKAVKITMPNLLTQAKQAQKTVAALASSVKASAGWKAIVNVINRTPVGYMLVQLGSQAVRVANKT